jgi:ABC-2 type transport system ATP-binding protein
VRGGTTVLLTTQYLDEADRLADAIAVVDHGRVIASGSPAELKARVGGERVVLTVADGALAPAAATLTRLAGERANTDEERREVSVPVPDGGLFAVVRALDEARVPASDIAVRGATLDDVFLALTGHDTQETDRR